jgi:eukaryotic-like serine/threonine-protein kinase
MQLETAIPLAISGHSRVLKAWDADRECFAAVKLLKYDDPEWLARMRREAEVQARLDHPHLCRIFEITEYGGQPAIVMQYIDGRPITEASHGLTVKERLQLMRQVIDGVCAAHEAGIVHRDLKPSNVLVEKTPTGRLHAYVLDFGLARSSEDATLTLTGHAIGTPGYMAPEQARGERDLDARADIYALGVMLFELLAHRRPFIGDSSAQLMLRTVNEDPPTLRRIEPGVPDSLSRIVSQCLEREPRFRYPSVQALAKDLDAYLAGRPVSARSDGRWLKFRRIARRNPTGTTATAIAAVLIMTLAGTAVFQTVRGTIEAERRAELAREFGRAAAAFEQRMRVTHLSRVHDISPSVAQMESELAALNDRLANMPATDRVAGLAALGAGRLALNQPEKAIESLLEAWTLGLQTPETARNLSDAYSRLYQSGRLDAERITNNDLRQRQLDEIDRSYREPALDYLNRYRERAEQATDAEIPARMALLDQRPEDAARLAAEAASGAPWRYEMVLLQGDAKLILATDARREGASDQALERLAEATAFYRRAAEIGASDSLTWLSWCRAHALGAEIRFYESGGSEAPAIEEQVHPCQMALEVRPGHINALVLISRQYARHGRALSRSGDDRAIEVLTRAETAARNALETEADNVTALRALGDALSYRAEALTARGEPAESDFRAAVETLERAVAVDPNNPRLWNSLGLAYWTWAEDAELHARSYETPLLEGIRAFSRAGQLFTQYTHAHSNLGSLHRMHMQLLIKSGRDPAESAEAARAAFARALAASPGNSYALNNLASVDRVYGQYLNDRGEDGSDNLLQAAVGYRAALDRNPDWAFPHFNLGVVNRELALAAIRGGRSPEDHLEASLKHFEHGTRLQPGLALADTEYAGAWNMLARWQLVQGADAIPAILQAQALLARSLVSDGNIDDTHATAAETALLAAAAHLRANDPATADQQVTSARQSALKAIEIDPSNATAHLLLGRALLARERLSDAPSEDGSDGALAALQRALEAKPDFAEARQALALARGVLGEAGCQIDRIECLGSLRRPDPVP